MIPPPPPGLRDEEEDVLVRRFRQPGQEGDEAYSELVRRYQTRVVRLVGYLLGDASEAEDVSQEAFVRAFSARDTFDRGDNFAAWIRTIATRVAFNCRRDKATRDRYHAEVEPPSATTSPAVEAEARNLLEQVLPQLSYAYREVLVLRYVEELSIGEIANMLNLGESAAKMRLSRARDEFWVLEKSRA
ncbi:MAG: polymerase sigma factor SigW [Pseudomonadota bacterium]|jgi:RNA polymerase sigma-70 factor (ECF subfamily)